MEWTKGRHNRSGRRNRLTACVLALGSLALLTAGCGGSSNDSDPIDTQGSQQSTEQGRTEVNAILNSLLSSNTDPTAQQIQSARNTFKTAYDKNPGNTQAAFGYAMTDLAASAQVVVDLVREATGRSHAEVSNDPLVLTVEQAIPWKVRRLSAQTGAETLRLMTGAPFTVSRLTRQRQVSSEQLRSALSNLRSAIDRNLPLMVQAGNDPTFNFAIVDYTDGDGNRSIDQGDAKTIVSSLYGVRAILALALAYDTNYGTFDFNQTLQERFAEKAEGAIVTPDEYLPAAPFGILTSDGRALFAAAKNDLKAAATVAVSAAQVLQARPIATGHLLDTDNVNWIEITAGIVIFNSALENPIQTGGENSVTINASAWFNNPPSSLRALLPTYTIRRAGDGTLLFLATADSFPDRTFGGLVTGISDEALQAAANGFNTVGELASAGGDLFD